MRFHVSNTLAAYVDVFIERVRIIFDLPLWIPSALWVYLALIRFEQVEPSETTIGSFDKITESFAQVLFIQFFIDEVYFICLELFIILYLFLDNWLVELETRKVFRDFFTRWLHDYTLGLDLRFSFWRSFRFLFWNLLLFFLSFRFRLFTIRDLHDRILIVKFIINILTLVRLCRGQVLHFLGVQKVPVMPLTLGHDLDQILGQLLVNFLVQDFVI